MKPLSLVCFALLAAIGCGEVADGPPDDGPDAGDTTGGGNAGTVPDTSITAAPAALVNRALARFEFGSDPTGASFECRVDGAAPAPCSSPYELAVDDGEHVFAVTAVAGDRRDSTPATHSWRVDTAPPDTRIVAGPAALDNSTEVELRFDADENATFACAVDGGEPMPCASPQAIGPIGDGDHEVVVTATDEAGNVDPTPALHAWTTDTSSPDTRIDQGPSGAVSSTVARWQFSSPDAGAGARFECALDGLAFAPCTSPVDHTGLAEGEHRFEVRAFDATGNVDPSPALATWTVDTIAPSISITSGPSGLTRDNTPTFEFTVAGAPSTIECQVDSIAWGPCRNLYTAARLGDGGHTFRVRATDAAGNRDQVSRSFSVDATPPGLTITRGPGTVIFNTPRVTFEFRATGHTGTRCRLYTAGSTPPGMVSCTSPRSYDIGFGKLVFEVQAYDAAGNTTNRTYAFESGELL